jgi:hypothetical protein
VGGLADDDCAGVGGEGEESSELLSPFQPVTLSRLLSAALCQLAPGLPNKLTAALERESVSLVSPKPAMRFPLADRPSAAPSPWLRGCVAVSGITGVAALHPRAGLVPEIATDAPSP